MIAPLVFVHATLEWELFTNNICINFLHGIFFNSGICKTPFNRKLGKNKKTVLPLVHGLWIG